MQFDKRDKLISANAIELSLVKVPQVTITMRLGDIGVPSAGDVLVAVSDA
jgi:hypothetical protein